VVRLQSLDADSSGTIDYEEFMAATISQSVINKEEHLYEAFKHFDAGEAAWQMHSLMDGQNRSVQATTIRRHAMRRNALREAAFVTEMMKPINGYQIGT
jgi:hypothetical protein